jgi:hypothetical protein
MLVFDPNIFKDNPSEKGNINTPNVNICSELFRKIVGKFASGKILYRPGLYCQVYGRQREKDDRQRNKYYFPAFFNNFAFLQK